MDNDDLESGELVNKIEADEESDAEEEKEEDELDENGKIINREFINCKKDHEFYYKLFMDDLSKFNQLQPIDKRAYLKENTTKFEIIEMIRLATEEAV